MYVRLFLFLIPFFLTHIYEHKFKLKILHKKIWVLFLCWILTVCNVYIWLYFNPNLQTGVGQTSHHSLLEQFAPISSSKPQSPEIESKSSVHKLYPDGHWSILTPLYLKKGLKTEVIQILLS